MMRDARKLIRKQLLVFAALGALLAGPVLAKTHDEEKAGVQVIGHVALNGLRADSLFVRQAGRSHRYLYITPGNGGDVHVVDISDPHKPGITKTVAMNGKEGGTITPLGVNAALVEIASLDPGVGIPIHASASKSKDVGIMDLSDPADPKLTIHFDNVSAYLIDHSHSLVYVVNAEGLWIVRHQEPLDPSVAAWEAFAAAP